MTTTIKTQVPLEEIRKIAGINPWAFYNFSVPEPQVRVGCTGVFLQTIGDEITRDEFALSVREAEKLIERYIGYNILPRFEKQSVKPIRLPNGRFKYPQTIQTKRKGYLQDLGAKKEELLGTFPIVPTDYDGDSFNETAVVDISAFSDIDINEIKVFYNNEGIEIRPVQIKDTGQVRKIEFPMYMVPKWSLISVLNEDALDSEESSNYEENVDVFRVYPDPDRQLDFVYYPGACADVLEKTTASGSGYVTDSELGYFTYGFSNNCCAAYPNEINANIYSGYVGDTKRPLVEVDSMFHLPVFALAVSLLDKNKTCCGGNTPSILTKFQNDFIQTADDVRVSRVVTEKVIQNPFGLTTAGAYFAHQFVESVRLFPH